MVESKARPESTPLAWIITDFDRVNFECVEYKLKGPAAGGYLAVAILSYITLN
ncbi:hypothetical protein L873DRAFT_1803201 [Choiromyces venosus 120613-1]|uniref:Uncharacterized protein n=1 Tax=Choiromyces venosus 120613-1 TaxID=1336337 RepID=A0A3N4JWU1_9PEZI|nr:hypothetical protein L873DRAFT_1803201 [Choiromyces venosus 120613-1]